MEEHETDETELRGFSRKAEVPDVLNSLIAVGKAKVEKRLAITTLRTFAGAFAQTSAVRLAETSAVRCRLLRERVHRHLFRPRGRLL